MPSGSKPTKVNLGGRSRYGGKRHVPGVMNKTEEKFADVLQVLKLAGEVEDWKFEPLKLRLGKNCWFTLDFAVLYADGVYELVDVKGGGPIADDALVKIKTAAEMFPHFRFVIEQLTREGGWKRTEY